MANVVSLVSELARFAGAAPTAMQVAGLLEQARAGNPQPLIEWAKTGGWADLVDAVRPGAGTASKLLLDNVMAALNKWGITVNGIDAQYRVLNGEPWDDFGAWLKRQTWGAFVILGPKGQGKTQLSLRLAEIWHDRRHYVVETINIYPEDTGAVPFVRHVGMKTFAKRIKALTKYLETGDENVTLTGPTGKEINQQLERGFDGQVRQLVDDPTIPTIEIINIEAFKRRVVIIDEASLSIGISGQDEGRRIARAAMAQARHLEWLVIYIGQLARMLPMDLMGVDATFVKKPNGREAETDRPEPIVERLWQAAGEGFHAVTQEPRWSRFPDYRSWAYVDCPTFGTKDDNGYRGMIPFTLAGKQAEVANGS